MYYEAQHLQGISVLDQIQGAGCLASRRFSEDPISADQKEM